ncbi:transposase [Escherichia coli DEC10A]|nr:transposase [Escherichia coli DEC10A]
MGSSLPDDINALKRLLAEQEALNRALLEKLNEREREIDHLQAQLDKLRRMNFGSRSEKVSRRIAQMEADLKALQKKVIPLPVGLTTRPCSARCVKPAPANRSRITPPRLKTAAAGSIMLPGIVEAH